MKKAPELDPLAERPAFDFSEGVRGKHHARVQEGTNAVLIAPDLLETFPDSDAVTEALRSLKNIAVRAPKARLVGYSPRQNAAGSLSGNVPRNLSL